MASGAVKSISMDHPSKWVSPPTWSVIVVWIFRMCAHLLGFPIYVKTSGWRRWIPETRESLWMEAWGAKVVHLPEVVEQPLWVESKHWVDSRA